MSQLAPYTIAEHLAYLAACEAMLKNEKKSEYLMYVGKGSGGIPELEKKIKRLAEIVRDW